MAPDFELWTLAPSKMKWGFAGFFQESSHEESDGADDCKRAHRGLGLLHGRRLPRRQAWGWRGSFRLPALCGRVDGGWAARRAGGTVACADAGRGQGQRRALVVLLGASQVPRGPEPDVWGCPGAARRFLGARRALSQRLGGLAGVRRGPLFGRRRPVAGPRLVGAAAGFCQHPASHAPGGRGLGGGRSCAWDGSVG